MYGHRQLGFWPRKSGWKPSELDNVPGNVQCECGVKSGTLPNQDARDKWHALHVEFERASKKRAK